MNIWSIVMLVAGGIFAGTVFAFAWERIPAWRVEPPEPFKRDFARTIDVADRLQPAILIVAIVGAVGFALGTDGTARALAFAGVAGLVATLLASLAVLVPLQRRIIALPAGTDAVADEMRRRWFTGHLGRTALSLLSFTALAIAVSA